jgi:hypothetical protein
MQQYPPPPKPRKRFDTNQAILVGLILVLFLALILSALPQGQFIRDFLRGALTELGLKTAY